MATLTRASFQTAYNIQSRSLDDGILGVSRNGNLHKTLDELRQLPPGEREGVLTNLSDTALNELASDVNAAGILGAGGLSHDEKRTLFDTLAESSTGKDLARLASAFDSRDDTQLLAESVANKGSLQSRRAYIEAMSPRTADNDFGRPFALGAAMTEKVDKDAKAILTVLNSFDTGTSEGRTSFDQAISNLPQSVLNNVAKAGINETIYSIDSRNHGVSYQPEAINKLLERAAKSEDASVKGKLFSSAANIVSGMRAIQNTPLVVSAPVANPNIQGITERMTALMNTDARGVTNQLNQADIQGTGLELSAYISEVLRNDPESGSKIIGEQLAQLQGAGTGQSPTDFFEQQVPNRSGKLYHQNAQNLGYYVGAMRTGVDKLNADVTKTGAIVKSILSASISAASLGRASGTVSGLTSLMVDEVVKQANGNRTKIVNELRGLAMPVYADGERYRGPAEDAFNSKAGYVRQQ